MKKLFFALCFLLAVGTSLVANSTQARHYFYGTYHDPVTNCDYSFEGYWDDNGGFHVTWDGPCGHGGFIGVRPSTGVEPSSDWSGAVSSYEIENLEGTDDNDVEDAALGVLNDAAVNTDL